MSPPPSREKLSGATYTPAPLAEFIAAQLALAAPRDRAPLRVLDPAVGDGALLIAAHAALSRAGFERVTLHGFDVDAAALAVARARFDQAGISVTLEREDFLHAADRLEAGSFDAVIANPPYVRTQLLGAERAGDLAKKFDLSGRVDLYQAFLVALSSVLAPGAVAALITSNRFLSVRAGATTRRRLWRDFWIHAVWDLGDTRLFDAAVLPAITLVEKKFDPSSEQRCPAMVSVYTVDSAPTDAQPIASPIDALTCVGAVVSPDQRVFEARRGVLVAEDGGAGVWRLSEPAGDAWLDVVRAHTWRRFEDVGRVRVGIKTTADAVFIREDWSVVEGDPPELLKPLVTHHIARRFCARPPRKKVLYTHRVIDGQRRAVDLASFPRARAYLERHRARLEGRRYLERAGRAWFEIWVPQDPAAWSRPKLVFRDIADTPQFWINLDGAIVNGDCYWMTLREDVPEEVLWLAVAVGNSNFICEFYDLRFNNKLYGGRRRFITQYVNAFPLPDPARPVCQEIIRLARRAHDAPEDPATGARIDRLVSRAMGVDHQRT